MILPSIFSSLPLVYFLSSPSSFKVILKSKLTTFWPFFVSNLFANEQNCLCALIKKLCNQAFFLPKSRKCVKVGVLNQISRHGNMAKRNCWMSNYLSQDVIDLMKIKTVLLHIISIIRPASIIFLDLKMSQKISCCWVENTI